MTPIIYSKNNCGPCNMLKLALREDGITYEERNISTSEGGNATWKSRLR
ncbi:glutaredoxin domain-containing protein [Jeotgalibaca porci]